MNYHWEYPPTLNIVDTIRICIEIYFKWYTAQLSSIKILVKKEKKKRATF